MKTRHPFATISVVSLALFLTGCTTGPIPESDTTSDAAKPTPTPTRDPGPVQLTDEEAAERYLGLVCQNNLAVNELATAFEAGEPEFFDGGAPDVTAAKAAAAKRVELNRTTIELLDDEYYVWPASVKDQIPHIRSAYMAELPVLVEIQNAESFENAYYASWPARTPEEDAAGQEIRYQLALDADTVASCVGHENGVTELASETSDRLAVLDSTTTE